MIEVNNSKYGFCTNDVVNCNDMAKLKQWLREQQDTLSSLSLSVERMKQSAQDGNPNDRYFSTCSAKRLQGVLNQQIINRIADLKQEQRMSIEQAFIEVAYKRLTFELFQSIKDEAKDLIGYQRSLKNYIE